jgi:thiol:disulfide interchange protein
MKTKLLTLSLAAIAIFGLATAQSTVNVEGQYAEPAQASPGDDISNQMFSVMIDGLSADGDTDYVYFEFPNEFEGQLSPNTVDSNVSVSSSNSLVDYDNDSVQETVEVGLSQDGNNSVTAEVILDAGVTYPDQFEDFEVNVAVEDSSNGEDSTSLEVTNSASEEETSDQDAGTGRETDPSQEQETENDDNEGAEKETTESDSSDSEGLLGGILGIFTGLF